jgi:hypothetical protein
LLKSITPDPDDAASALPSSGGGSKFFLAPWRWYRPPLLCSIHYVCQTYDPGYSSVYTLTLKVQAFDRREQLVHSPPRVMASQPTRDLLQASQLVYCLRDAINPAREFDRWTWLFAGCCCACEYRRTRVT